MANVCVDVGFASTFHGVNSILPAFGVESRAFFFVQIKGNR